MLVAIKMLLDSEKEILKKTDIIILFYSNSCPHCVEYKQDNDNRNWLNLVEAAKAYKPTMRIFEIDVKIPENKEIVSVYHQGGIPNTVFLDKCENFLFSNKGNFNTSRLVKEFKEMGRPVKPEITCQKDGYTVEYRTYFK
jgi:hypothetical protein